MPNELENMAKALMSSPQGYKIIKGLDAFSASAQTPNGRQLIAMLGAAGGDELKRAAEIASKTDKDPARVLLSNLLATKDGAALVAKIIEVLGV